MFKKVAAANEECYDLPGVNEIDEGSIVSAVVNFSA